MSIRFAIDYDVICFSSFLKKLSHILSIPSPLSPSRVPLSVCIPPILAASGGHAVVSLPGGPSPVLVRHTRRHMEHRLHLRRDVPTQVSVCVCAPEGEGFIKINISLGTIWFQTTVAVNQPLMSTVVTDCYNMFVCCEKQICCWLHSSLSVVGCRESLHSTKQELICISSRLLAF